MTGPEPSEPIERLLVAALRARADAVTQDDLRPARPPSMAHRCRAPVPVRRAAVALLGLAAAVAAVLFVVAERDPAAPPADSPPPTSEPTQDPPDTDVSRLEEGEGAWPVGPARHGTR